MIVKLLDACTIHTGYTARSRLEPAMHGGTMALHLRDLPLTGMVQTEHLTSVLLDAPADRYLAHGGDVVFRSRGNLNTAVVIDPTIKESAVVILPLLILRPRKKVIRPDYLAWVINQPPAQRHFDRSARGTNMRMIPRDSLDTLEVNVPDMKTQARIVAVDSLAERERELSILVAEKRKKRMSLLLLGDQGRRSGQRHEKGF